MPPDSCIAVPRQAVDRHASQQHGLVGVLARQPGEQPQRLGDAHDRIEEGEHAPTTVGPHYDVLRQHASQRLDVAVSCRREKGMYDPVRLGFFQTEPGPRRPNVPSRTHRQLAHGSRIPIQRARDIVQRDAEYVMEKESGPLQWRETLKRQHQRECDVVGLLVLGAADERLWKPGAHISLATDTRGSHLIEAQPRHDARQIGRWGIDRLFHPRPTQPGVLHHVLGLRDRAKHPIGEAEQPGPLRLEIGECRIRRRHGRARPDARRGSRSPAGSRR